MSGTLIGAGVAAAARKRPRSQLQRASWTMPSSTARATWSA